MVRPLSSNNVTFSNFMRFSYFFVHVTSKYLRWMMHRFIHWLPFLVASSAQMPCSKVLLHSKVTAKTFLLFCGLSSASWMCIRISLSSISRTQYIEYPKSHIHKFESSVQIAAAQNVNNVKTKKIKKYRKNTKYSGIDIRQQENSNAKKIYMHSNSDARAPVHIRTLQCMATTMPVLHSIGIGVAIVFALRIIIIAFFKAQYRVHSTYIQLTKWQWPKQHYSLKLCKIRRASAASLSNIDPKTIRMRMVECSPQLNNIDDWATNTTTTNNSTSTKE